MLECSSTIPHDRPAPADGKIEVTSEMIEAGVSVLIESGRLDTDYEQPADALLVQRIFLTMQSRRDVKREAKGSNRSRNR
jgi:hypothetical protein